MVTGVLDGTGQRGDGDAVAVRLRDDVIGRGAQRVGDELDLAVLAGVLHRDVDVATRHRVQPAQDTGVDAAAVGQRRDAQVGEGALDERPVLRRDHRVEVDLEPSVGILAGMTTSTPKASLGEFVHPLQHGVEPVGLVEAHAPGTPGPPARLIAAATSSLGVKPKIGYSMPKRSLSWVSYLS